jgi:hypothetical protein
MDSVDFRRANTTCQRIIDVCAEKAKECATRFASTIARVAFLFLRHNGRKYCRIFKEILRIFKAYLAMKLPHLIGENIAPILHQDY